MKALLFPLLLLSLSLTAQKKERIKPFFKTDTVKILSQEKLYESFGLSSEKQHKDLYRIMTFKPKDSVSYLALKEPDRDLSKYKILNPITPEKQSINTKEAPKLPK